MLLKALKKCWISRKEAQKSQKGFDVKQEHSLNDYDDCAV
jgi:hypothetical protein